MIFKTGNGITQTGNGIIFATSRPLIRNFLLQNVFHLFQWVQYLILKQEMELSKQEMELFPPLAGLWSKNLFYKMFLNCSKGFKIDFQNRKWNYPNRKWNYFCHFQASDQKLSFTKCFSFIPMGKKFNFRTGNGIIQTGNGIISPTYRPLIKKLILRNVSQLF